MVIDLLLRVNLFVNTLAPVLLLATSKQTVFFTTSPSPPFGAASLSAYFTDAPALIFAISGFSLACLYSIITALLSFLDLRKQAARSINLMFTIFVMDLLLFGIVAAVAGAAGDVLITMGDPAARMRALMDFSQPKINDIQSSIVRPAITANTFEIKPGIIQWYPTQRLPHGKVAGVLEVDTDTAITAQLKALSTKIDSLANYGINQITSRSQQPVPDTYHPDNWNHPNFNWSNNQNAMQQPFQQFGNKLFNPPGFQQQITPKQQTHGACLSSNEKYELEELRLMCQNQALICQSQAVSIKTLENQIGQIANALLNRPPGTLPSDIETNPGKREVEE
ncbi:hypothetical protein AgCh_032544 [Apium graveolens]